MSIWNFTLEDSAPFITYAPCADCNLTAGWAPWFGGSNGFRDPSNPGEYGQGTSLHYTYTPGASLEFEFHGTALYLFGSANCTYDVSIDSGLGGSGLTSTSDLLFAKTDLSPDTHLVNLTVHASGVDQFAFDRAIFSDLLPSGIDNLLPEVYDNSNSSLHYSGNWQSLHDTQIPSLASPKNYTQTSDSMAAVSLNFTGSAVAINGPPNWGHWTYNVTLDGVSSQFNASTYWLVGNTVLFYASGLDFTKEHQIELINAAGAGMIMSLNDITVYTLPNMTAPNPTSATRSSPATSVTSPSVTSAPSDSSHKVNTGAIVGPVVACVVFALVLAAYFFYKRRRRAVSDQDDSLVAAPYFGGYAQSRPRDGHGPRSPGTSEKGDITILSPPAQPYSASTMVMNDEPFDPYGSHLVNQAPPSQQYSPGPLSGLSAPTQLSSSQQTTQARNNGVDVNAIIEMIAQRIDRPPLPPHIPPPQYPSE